MPDYEHYLADERSIDEYIAYQARYLDEPRESDKVLIRGAVAAQPQRLLDIGCSTGNLLLHVRSALPDCELVGGDIRDGQLDVCRANPALGGIAFEHLDVTDLGVTDRYDCAIVNAVFGVLDAESFAKAVASIGQALRPGGTLLAFDWFHSWPQNVEIREVCRGHPDGMTLRFRSRHAVVPLLEAAGFTSWDFAPFEIPIDLDGKPTGPNESGFEDLNTRTVKDEHGNRMLFRGVLYQPWCHLTAVK